MLLVAIILYKSLNVLFFFKDITCFILLVDIIFSYQASFLTDLGV